MSIKLKQLIRYTNAPALEATWVEDIDGQEVTVKCQAYDNSQMAMLAADLGEDAAANQALMDEIAATYVEPPPEPLYVPPSVTPRQARLALAAAALLDQVDATIDAMEEPQRSQLKIEWEYTNEINRDYPWVTSLAGSLGLDDAALDQLFITAAEL